MDKPVIIPPAYRSVLVAGLTAIGSVPEDIASMVGKSHGSIMLLNGFDNGRNGGFGLAHIASYQKRKNFSTERLGFADLKKMVAFGCNDPDRICLGKNGRLIFCRLQAAEQVWVKTVIDWSDERSCWHVITAIPSATCREEVIWEKQAG